MKRMWSVLRVGLIIGATVTLVSCNVIQGELTLLVDDREHPAHSPHWSSDGSKIYFILGEDDHEPDPWGSVWKLDLEDNALIQITDQVFCDFDVSPDGDFAVTDEEREVFWIRDLETWDKLYSCQPCKRVTSHLGTIPHVKFSLESEHILYYAYWFSGFVFLHRINLTDSLDEELLSIQSSPIFAPGPGDTLIALNDTVYNLTTGEQIPIPIKTGLKELQWNPVVPAELLISLGDNGLFLFNLVERKTYRIEINTPKGYDIVDARFSPDGESIVLLASWNGDGFFENQIWLFEPLD